MDRYILFAGDEPATADLDTAHRMAALASATDEARRSGLTLSDVDDADPVWRALWDATFVASSLIVDVVPTGDGRAHFSLAVGAEAAKLNASLRDEHLPLEWVACEVATLRKLSPHAYTQDVRETPDDNAPDGEGWQWVGMLGHGWTREVTAAQLRAEGWHFAGNDSWVRYRKVI